MRTALLIVGGLAVGAWTAGGWAAGAGAEEVGISAFFGKWQGVEIAAEGAQKSLGLAPADLDIVISQQGDGFRLEGLSIGRRAPDSLELTRRSMGANFAPTEVPGVYAFDPGGSLFTSLFADPATGNPLDGDTLLWARLEEGTLHLYSLSINPVGGFDLEHGRGTLEGDVISIDFVGYMEDAQVFTIEGRLERAGG
jgi:hypothetical protein